MGGSGRVEGAGEAGVGEEGKEGGGGGQGQGEGGDVIIKRGQAEWSEV